MVQGLACGPWDAAISKENWLQEAVCDVIKRQNQQQQQQKHNWWEFLWVQQDQSDSETLFITPWECPLTLHLIWLNCGLLPKGVPLFVLSSCAPQAAGCVWSFVSQNTHAAVQCVRSTIWCSLRTSPFFFCRTAISRISEQSQLTLRPHDWRVHFTLVKEGQGMEKEQFLSVVVVDSGDNLPALCSRPVASLRLSAFVPLLVSSWA